VKYRRLTLDAGDTSVSLAFHERLTVVAGVGRLERETLVSELLGALAGEREGVRLEVEDDDGCVFELARSPGGEAVALEVGSNDDVSGRIRQPDGRVDLLAASGLDTKTARRFTRLNAADVATSSQSESMVLGLARVDQATLWHAAEAFRSAGERLEHEASAAGSTIEDAEVVDEIEHRHLLFEAAAERQERVRAKGLLVAGFCAVGAIPATLLKPPVALPFLAVTVAMMLVAIVLRHRLERARQAEERALAAAGARSYLGFHLQRVEGLLARGEMRDRLARAAEDHRQAHHRWVEVAGIIEIDWALARRDRIESAAASLAASGAGVDDVAPVEPSDLAHAVVTRLTELRAGLEGRTFPLILDEPFAGADGTIKHWLLELIGTSAGNPQIVYLTEDEDVAAWARMEAMTGDLAVVEPAAEQHEAEVA
jgi:hypothetical protein